MAGTMSDYEKKRKKTIRETRIKNHQCGVCGKQDERTLSGFTLCEDHQAKQRARLRKYRSTGYGKYMTRKRNTERNNKCKELGICVSCCKNDAKPGRFYCEACIARYTERNRKYLDKKKKEKENDTERCV